MRKFQPRTLAVALAVTSGAWLWAPSSYALNTKPMNVSDLVRESTQIVVGTVSAVTQGMGANNLPYTEVELKVSESILGKQVTTLTFRQFGLQSPLPAANGRRYIGLVAGMPHYQAGDAVLLFLGRISPIGYRATIGLGNGRFALQAGNLMNDVNNTGLFKDVDLSGKPLTDKEKHLVTTTQGAVGAETFLAFLRRAVAENWWTGQVGTPPRVRPAPRSTVPRGAVAAGGSANE